MSKAQDVLKRGGAAAGRVDRAAGPSRGRFRWHRGWFVWASYLDELERKFKREARRRGKGVLKMALHCLRPYASSYSYVYG
jgi:hypothetical protein